MTIRTASALTGINQNTLRAWERRHGLLSPERTPKGYRLYSTEDLERLRKIQHALQQGIPIGRMREHLDAPPPGSPIHSVRHGVAPRHAEHRHRDGAVPSGLEDFARELEQAALRFDRPALDRIFSRAVGMHTLPQAFTGALAPALRCVGERYLKDLAHVAEEHFLAAFARDRLAAALAGLRPLHQQPRVLCACAPGEQHEIGLMVLALAVGLEGVSTLYLGRDVPLEAIAHAAAETTCRAVVLSSTIRLPREALLDLRSRLAAQSRHPALMVGGPAAERERAWIEEHGMTLLPLEHAVAAPMVLASVRRS